MIITYRNPKNFDDTIDVYFDILKNNFTDRWKKELKNLLQKNYHLEKNYCFMGFVDNNPRNIDYLCKEINQSIHTINQFNITKKWEEAGLKSYHIDDHFTKDLVMYSEDLPIGNAPTDEEIPLTLGCRMKHDAMNRLHRYFEDLQGEAWGLSSYYKTADYKTKYAIRQLNDLCHELESYLISYRKSKFEPEWSQPSQINTWLQAPRQLLHDDDYFLFEKNRYDKECGGVYLHWAQVGKTHIEVFNDENGADVDDVICSTINSLKYYTGEFDISWARDITQKNAPWHQQQQSDFFKWLKRNNFDIDDPKLALGYIKIGQCDLMKSFGTNDPQKIWKILSNHLDVYKIKIQETENIFDYVWTQSNFKQMQIDIMKPGYDFSSTQHLKY